MTGNEQIADGEAFRVAMRRMAATVSILTTRCGNVSYGMTVTAVSSISMSPPTLMVAVNQRSSIYRPLLSTRSFWINMLHHHQVDACAAFSGREKGEDRFKVGAWINRKGAPFLKGAQANVFCEVIQDVAAGTHTLFIGRVAAAYSARVVQPMIYLDGEVTAPNYEQTGALVRGRC